MYTCANCKVQECLQKNKDNSRMPKNCPMRDKDYLKEIFDEYKSEEVHKFYVATKSSRQPNTSLDLVPILRSAIDICKKMGYKKIGLAFCIRFSPEAELYSQILRKHGFEVVSVCCCNGAFNIADFGVPLPQGCDFDAACNPLGQARLVNEQNVEYNLVMGLCFGHDALFMKNANAMSSVICVKDPATGHCPPKALYLYKQYYEPYFEPSSNEKDEK